LALRETLLDKPNEFFISKREYFTLIIAVIVSLTFVFNNDQPQIDAVRRWFVEQLAVVQARIAWYRGLRTLNVESSALRQRATTLMLENAQLREALLENLRLRRLLNFRDRSTFSLVPARVLAQQEHPFNKEIELNVGSLLGVRRNMPVVTPAGLAGKISRVQELASTIQLLEDNNFKASARIQRSREYGIVEFDERKGLQLTAVAKNSDVKAGDLVVTSEASALFPPGIRIGVVSDIKLENSSLFMDITITPDVDVSQLEEVFVVVASLADSTH